MKRFRVVREEGESMDSINMANVLMLLSRGGGGSGGGLGARGGDEMIELSTRPSSPVRVFECKTCNRQFPSFQALGGHRASHKKPRLTPGADGAGGQAQGEAAKPRVHECSICGLEFAIGQALGGHMRRHRAALTDSTGFRQGIAEKKPAAGFGHGITEKKPGDGKRLLWLDLNAPLEEETTAAAVASRPNKIFGFELVDCLHLR